MTDSNRATVQAAQSKTTSNYAVYDSPDGDDTQDLVGTYITTEVAEQLGEYISLDISVASDDPDGLVLSRDKETSSYGVYSSEADAVESAYISHELLDRIGARDEDRLNVVAHTSDEAAFDEALAEQTTDEEATAAEADALLGSKGSQMVSDEEVGLE